MLSAFLARELTPKELNDVACAIGGLAMKKVLENEYRIRIGDKITVTVELETGEYLNANKDSV